MNARQAWRERITSLIESAPVRNDAELEQVSAAMATAIERGAAEKLVAAGHVPEFWGSVNRAPFTPQH